MAEKKYEWVGKNKYPTLAPAGKGTYEVTWYEEGTGYTSKIITEKQALDSGLKITKNANVASSVVNPVNPRPSSSPTPTPTKTNVWKTDSVPTKSTMSSPTPDPYATRTGTETKGTTDPTAIAIYEMSIPQRKELATLLKNAGYKVAITGKYSDALVQAYVAADQAAQLQSAKLGKPFTVREYLAQEAVPTAGTASTQPSIREDIQIWNPTKTAGVVQDLSVKLLGREATPEEVTYLADKLTAAQKKAATKTQYVTKGGKVTATVTGGLDEEQFLIDAIQKDKKFAAELEAIKAKKATTEASAVETTRQDLIKTALANGITLNADQIANFEERIKAGEQVNAIKNTIRETAALGMPDQVKKLVGSGVDLSTVYSPYKSILAQTLEINPNSITLDDPTLRMAIGPDKEMSLYEYQRALRKDNRWQYTDQARSEASDVAKTVLKDFGFMG